MRLFQIGVIVVVCVLHSAASHPANNVTDAVTDAKTSTETTTEVPSTPTPTLTEKNDVDSKIKKNKEKETMKKTYMDLSHGTGGKNPFKANRPFPNFPALETGDDGFGMDGGKRDFMIKLFFGRDPVDFDIVEDRDEPRFPSKPEDDLKEMPFYPPQFTGPERDAPSKFDMFPYERVAQPYDSSKNINNQKQEFLNKEYNFKPFFNFNEDEQRMSEMERYEYLLEQRRRFGQNENVRYVYHPYFGYIPTDEVTDDIVDDINLDQLFQLHPRHGFVPATNDKPGQSSDGYNDRFTPDMDDMDYPKRRPFSPNGGDQFASGPMPMRDEKPLNIQVIGKPEQSESSDEEMSEMEYLNRNRREPQVVLPQYYYQPAPPFGFYPPSTGYQHPSMFYQPQYLYGPPALRNIQLPVTKPLFTLTDAMKLRSDAADVSVVDNSVADVDVADDDEEEEGDISLPVEPPGAHVANDPLPEKTFPIFPYDPEQDEPAAVAF